MAIITLKELCYGERYGVISEVFKTIVNKTQSSIPENFDTFRDLEYVRQTLIAVKKMQENGDYISEYELERAPVVLSVDDQRFYREQIAILYPDVEEKYLETLRHYLKNVPISFLSFDYYPVIMDGENRVLRDAWYHNLEDIRTAANEAKIPIWSFALAKPHGPYPIPTLADLRIQHFSNLVYGAVAFQYFTTSWIVWNDAVNSTVYPIVKQVNKELKQMEPIFLGADIKDIWHTGETIPRGTKALTSYPSGITNIKTGNNGTVVSYFTNKGKQYIAFVNRSCTEETTLEIAFETEAIHVAKDGTEIPVSSSYTIEAGDIRIFSWK